MRLLDATTALPLGPDWRFDVGVASIAFDPDGASLAVGLSDGTTQVRSLAETVPALRPVVMGDAVHCLAVAPDGTMAMGTPAGDVFLRDPRTGALERVYQSPGLSIHHLVFSPDGRTLAIGIGVNMTTSSTQNVGHVVLLNMGGRKRLGPTIPAGGPVAVPYRFSRDGKTLYTKAANARLRLWDTTTGLSLGRDFASPSGPSDVALSADERYVLVSDPEGHVRRHDLATGTELNVWPLQKQAIYAVKTVSHGDHFITFSADWSVRAWNATTGAALGPPIEHESYVTAAAVDRDGRTLAVGTAAGAIEFWDITTGLPLGRPIRLGTDRSCDDLKFLPSGGTLAFVSSGQVFLYELPTGIAGTRDEVRRWVEVQTGWTVDPSGTVAQLGPAEWENVRKNAPAGPRGDDKKDAFDNPTDRHLSRALIEIANGEYHAALWNFDRVITANTAEPVLLLGRAEASAMLGRAEAAAADLTRVLALKPAGVESWIYFCRLLGSLDGLEHRLSLREQAIERTQGTGSAHVLEPLPPDVLPRIGHSPGAAGTAAMMHLFNHTKRRVRLRVLSGADPGEDFLDLAPESTDTAAWEVSPGQPLLASDATTGAPLSIWFPERGDSLLVILDEKSPLLPPTPGETRARRSAWLQVKVLTGNLEEATRIVESSENGVLLAGLAARAAANRDWPRAAVLLRRVLDLSHDGTESPSPSVAYDLALTLLAQRDLEEYRALCTRELATINPAPDASLANSAAWLCALGPCTRADAAMAVKLAESAVASVSNNQMRAAFLNTLGAVLYRANEFDRAIDSLMEGLRYKGGETDPQDLVFLAMAHFRKGRAAEAARWLKQLPEAGIVAPGRRLSVFEREEIPMLRGEAESLILYDPVFPADPFARR